MNRVAFLTTSMMTPAERAVGRFMRAPDHPLDDADAGGTQTGAEDNRGGNSGESETGENTEDNTSQDTELKGFWDAKPDEGASGESEEDKQASQELGQKLGGLIQGFQGPEVFNKEIADAIADGDLTKVNEALANRDQAILKHSAVVAAQLVGGLMDRMTKDFEARIQRALGNKDAEITLETHFPLAKDPAMRPMVQRVWDQALVNSKGDKQKAIRLTRGMLEAFGEKTSLREAPEDTTAGIGTPAAKSLVADLLERP